jgi:pimeloyl-ACP methyl ester carboxylesterase
MSSRHRLAILIALAVVLLAARSLAPPPSVRLGSMGRGPTVVFVHGLGSGPSHWLPVARAMARHHRVALVSLPGHADMPMAEPLTFPQAALGLEAALSRELGDEPVVLVGHSIGGVVAAALALDHPERVRGLVLVETALRPPFTPDERKALESALARNLYATLRPIWYGFGRDSAQGAALWGEASALDAAALRDWVRLALGTDLSHDVASLRMPVLAVLAERSWPRDEPWAVTAAALGYERLRQVEAVRLGGAGHFVMLDEPAALAALIHRFASSASAPVITAARIPPL